MAQQSLFALVPKASDLPTLPGKDEMNLAEFPLTKLGSRDTRDVLEFTTYALDQQKRAYQQQWIVRGATGCNGNCQHLSQSLMAFWPIVTYL